VKLVKRKPQEGEKMNMTPMIDVVFQLLIFFMIVTEMTQSEKVDLTLPRTTQATPDEGERGRYTINVTKTGRILLGTQHITLDRLSEILGLVVKLEGKKKFSETPILIRADKKTQFEIVQKIMGKCVEHKIWKISFGSKTGIEERDVTVGGGGS
jgi:biopolymer transport protein ExbD